MEFSFRQMNQLEAEEIANNWKYDGVYSFYDMTADEEDYAEFIDPIKRGDSQFSCYVHNELAAFYSVNIVEGNKAMIGFGLKPELTGKGCGLDFVNAVMAHVTSRLSVADFTLSVALFNLRAIKVYKKAGFTETEVYMQKTNGGEYEFLRMEKMELPGWLVPTAGLHSLSRLAPPAPSEREPHQRDSRSLKAFSCRNIK